MITRSVVDILQERGCIETMTPGLEEALKKSVGVYLGFDPTADSLHLGNLMGLVMLSWFQKCGHRVFALAGGATGMIGDPSGKSSERSLLDDETLAHNVASLTKFLKKILFVQGGVAPLILNNNDWLGEMSLIHFLRDVGKLFRVGPMIAKESVRARLQSEEGISFTEFSYQILQAYDFCFLHEHHGVSLQIGGSDQWGNITAGIELQRKRGGEPLHGLTFPLLTRSDGKKFGKTEEGAIWLSEERLSPYDFYQILVRIPDADVISLLKRLTFLPLGEIATIEAEMRAAHYIPNSAQKRLAAEVTRFVHGEEGLASALRVTAGMAPGESGVLLTRESLEKLERDIPPIALLRSEVVGVSFASFAVAIGLAPSKAEVVRLIKNGGAYLNNKRVEDPQLVLGEKDLIEEIYLLASAGKKRRLLVKLKG
ncbi:MAG: tyrosine--tRNA ligase [Verrucomicrobiota bacterium]|nr:tyrosine--tRNA ligase [Verrucomicrobiota bacterium]